MANRLLLGNRSSGGYGLYISRPGANVLTCDDTDLIFTSETTGSSVIHAIVPATLADGETNVDVSWSNIGYIPMIHFTQASAASGGTVTGQTYSFSSTFVGSTLVFTLGHDFIVTNISATGAKIQTRALSTVSGDKFFRIIVYKYEMPS